MRLWSKPSRHVLQSFSGLGLGEQESWSRVGGPRWAGRGRGLELDGAWGAGGPRAHQHNKHVAHYGRMGARKKVVPDKACAVGAWFRPRRPAAPWRGSHDLVTTRRNPKGSQSLNRWAEEEGLKGSAKFQVAGGRVHRDTMPG